MTVKNIVYGNWTFCVKAVSVLFPKKLFRTFPSFSTGKELKCGKAVDQDGMIFFFKISMSFFTFSFFSISRWIFSYP